MKCIPALGGMKEGYAECVAYEEGDGYEEGDEYEEVDGYAECPAYAGASKDMPPFHPEFAEWYDVWCERRP